MLKNARMALQAKNVARLGVEERGLIQARAAAIRSGQVTRNDGAPSRH
jgi:hypothetical protein